MLLPRSQGPSKPSSLSASGALSDGQAEEAPTAQAENVTAMGNTIDVIANTENNRTDAPSGGALQVPSAEDMDSWTLAQLRTHLEEAVVQKRIASGHARNDLETWRLFLIERITRLERAEEKKRDAARRGALSLLEILIKLN